MIALGWNLVLALVWCALAGRIDLVQFGIGFAVGYAILALVPERTRGYHRRLPRMLWFAAWYAIEVVRSSLRVARDVLRSRARRRPGIVAVPLDGTSDAEVALLANLVTFTPGTLALDVGPDRRTLLVHDMFVCDVETSRHRIKQLERAMLRMLR
jgi:multicomponent Na+:H+ antiporter subunit E